MKKYYVYIISALVSMSTARAQVVSFEIDETKINTEVAGQLDSLWEEDQQYRVELNRLTQIQAPQSQKDSMWNLINAKDKANLDFIEKIIRQYGWLGPQDIGFKASQTLFLVIQHADLAAQQKYYPLIKQAEKEEKILSSNVALLEDRIAIREGREQTYGSQGYFNSLTMKVFTYPVKDIDHLDSLRHSMGLPPMKEYRDDWDVEDYKSYLPAAKEKLESIAR